MVIFDDQGLIFAATGSKNIVLILDTEPSEQNKFWAKNKLDILEMLEENGITDLGRVSLQIEPPENMVRPKKSGDKTRTKAVSVDIVSTIDKARLKYSSSQFQKRNTFITF